MFGIPYVRQDWIEVEVAKAAARDPFGHRLHLILGLAWLAAVPGPMILVQTAGVGLWVLAVFRAYYIHRTWRSFGCHPSLWVIAAWVGWQIVSTTWSPDANAGWWEIHSNRWVWAMWLTWSVMQHRSAMIAALVAGFVAANMAQAVDGFGTSFGVHAITFDRAPDRVSGWWWPVVGGTMLVGALGLHLPAAVMGRGRMQSTAIVGSVVSFSCIIVTGSRGAWIAAVALFSVVVAVAVVRRVLRRAKPRDGVVENGSGPRRSRLVRAIVIVAGVGSMVAAVWMMAGDGIARRVREGRNEVVRAIEHRDYNTWTGARILMMRTAWEELSAHPVRGVGAGGYQKWAQVRDGVEAGNPIAIHRHAHNMYLHIAATTGIVGLGLWMAVLAMGVWGGLRGVDLGSYAAGPGFALIGLMLAGLTDVVHLNGQTSALLFVVLGLCIWPRPSETAWPRWDREAWGRPFPK